MIVLLLTSELHRLGRERRASRLQCCSGTLQHRYPETLPGPCYRKHAGISAVHEAWLSYSELIHLLLRARNKHSKAGHHSAWDTNTVN